MPHRPRVMNRQSGTPTIYFIADRELEAIKIGYSANVRERFTTLQTASSRPLVLLGTMPGTIMEEQRLHRRFERTHGEWFRPTAELLAFIREHAEVTEMFKGYRPSGAPAHPRRRMRLVERLHLMAYVEIVAFLVMAAYGMLHFVLLPALFVRLSPPNEFYLLSELFYGFVCLYALTYRHARQSPPPAPGPELTPLAERPYDPRRYAVHADEG